MNNRNHQKQEKHFIVDILFVLALFGVFAVSALALVTIGACTANRGRGCAGRSEG